MNDFNSVIKKLEISSNNSGVSSTSTFNNIPAQELLTKLICSDGNKNGSHYLRTFLKVDEQGNCLDRSDIHLSDTAQLLIIDCDESYGANGVKCNGSPQPILIQEALKSLGIGHIVVGSHTHYASDYIHKCRILVITNKPYTKEQLAPTAKVLVGLINSKLGKPPFLAYANENNRWSQPWFYHRRNRNSTKPIADYRYLNGSLISVFSPIDEPNEDKPKPKQDLKPGEISPIESFNEQYDTSDLLKLYGYKLCLQLKDKQRWLYPESGSGIAGVIVKDNKLFSHHGNDPLNDGYWHDAFDLMRTREGLTLKEAVIKASQNTITTNNRCVDEHNKSLLNNNCVDNTGAENDANDIIKDTSPWPNEVKPVQLLNNIKKQVERFIICDEDTSVAATLWIAFTWFIDVVNIAPIALITAPEKRCGKSTLLRLLSKLVKRPIITSNMTSSVLFRISAEYKPTLLIDEADTINKENEELRGIINAGHERDNAVVWRSVRNRHDFKPTPFKIFCAKALAGIGQLQGTIMDRSIVLELRRKKDGEHVERLRNASNELEEIASQLARLALDNKQIIRKSSPNLPTELNDREQDNWEPLLAIADLAGGAWPEQSRQTAIALHDKEDKTSSIGIDLLKNIKEVFNNISKQRISTKELIKELSKDAEQPWLTYNKNGQITERQIATTLKKYSIQSTKIRFKDKSLRGYYQKDFEEAWNRYL